MTKSHPLMIQGTGSHVGKSVLVAALGRIFSDMGYRVAPFKAQNMALNSAVVGSGARVGEIGRSQALQARACRVEPSVDMNPVLLKPGEGGCQIIVQGRVWGSNTAREYGLYADEVLQAVRESYRRLAEQYEIILIEGAGSPAEVNLLERDLPNHWIAREAQRAGAGGGHIDPGGVFAALLGTWMIVPEAWRIRGFLLNQFRGDASLLGDGMEWLRRRTGVPTLGRFPGGRWRCRKRMRWGLHAPGRRRGRQGCASRCCGFPTSRTSPTSMPWRGSRGWTCATCGTGPDWSRPM